MTYIAYLDKLGRVGPYVAGIDPRYNDRPVFGLAEFIMPADAVRGFESWMAKRKYELLEFRYPALAPAPGGRWLAAERCKCASWGRRYVWRRSTRKRWAAATANRTPYSLLLGSATWTPSTSK